MKFGKTFESLLTTEWRQQYMNYADLKAMIRRATDNAPDPKAVSKLELELYYKDFETVFFSTCLEELNRVNEFFQQKVSESRRKLATLKYQFLVSDRHRDPLGHAKSKMHLEDEEHRKPLSQRKLRLASSEFYLSLIMLQNYQTLNHTAFRKICKKYDKYIKSNAGMYWFKGHALNAEYAKPTELVTMLKAVEDLYTAYLTNGDRSKAMAKLRVPPLGEKTSPTRVFLSGLFLGLFIVGTVMSVISWFTLDLKPDFKFMFVSLLRGPLMLIVYGIYLSLNVGIWQKVGINHVLIFELEHRNHMGFLGGLEIASFCGYLLTIVVLAYLYSDEFGIKEYYILPLIYITVIAVMILNPIRLLNYPFRIWLMKLCGRVMAAPFFYVGFADFWMGDQMTSMVQCFVDHYYLFRFYIRYYNKEENSYGFEPDYGVALIRCLPAWFRFAQCLRRYRDSGSKSKQYLMNAVKYSLSILVVIFSTIQMETNSNYNYMFENPWTWLYLFTALLTSVYCLFWDLVKDFGLFKIWKWENLFLRENLVYPKWFYYFAIVENSLLRFVWILEIVFIYFDVLNIYNCKSLIIFCEITRRFVWNLLRLENEHLNNCGKFRATRDIFLTTLNPTEELLLERMMDESDQRSSGRPSSQTLERLLVNEWREQYVNYELLKEKIKMGVDEAPDSHDYPLILIHEYYEEVKYEFFTACATEMVKVQLFFKEKLAASHRKQESFKATLVESREVGGAAGSGIRQFHMRYPTMFPQQQPQTIRQLRNAYSEFYLSLILLQNYQTLNQTAFRKICKKYDKNFSSSEGQMWYKTVVERSPFTYKKDLKNIIEEVEELFTQYLTQGDRSKAMTRLRVPPLGQPQNPFRVFFAGLFLGLFLVAALLAGISYIFLDLDDTFRVLFVHLYRGPFLLICYYFLVGANLFIWQRAGINYVLIFELNPRHYLTSTAVLQIASTLAYGWMLCALAFLHHDMLQVEKPFYFPLIFLGVVIAVVLNPFPILEYSARMWLLSRLIRILAGPFLYVTFADFWLSEQITSLTLCLVDHYMLCRFVIRYYGEVGNPFEFEPDYGVAILRVLPAWLRMCQCFRRYMEGTSKSYWYGLNALKYSLSIVTVVFSTIQMETNAKYQSLFHNPWTYGYILSALCCTIYQSFWDLRNDFGLFHAQHNCLREKLIYRKSLYYFIIIAELLLRSFWLLELFLVIETYVTPYNCKTFGALCEIFLRFLWNLLRLENEHLYNCGNFRATRDISLWLSEQDLNPQQNKIYF